MATKLAPTNDQAIRNFGKGDRRKLQNYLLMLAAFLEGKNPHTKRSYKTALRQFFELFEWTCPEDITPAHAAAFKKWLLEHRQTSHATTYQRMCAVSSFFDYLSIPPSPNAKPLIQHNPFKAIPKHDIQPTPYAYSKAMDWDTFRSIIDATPSNVMGMRDKAILIFFAFTGRRRQEVAALRIRDLDLKSSPRSYTCRVKGGRVLSFELPDVCYEAIKAYWIISDRLDTLTPDAGVFTAACARAVNKNLDRNKPLDARTLNHVLHRCTRRAGFDPTDESIGIHAMRHMTAQHLDEAGVRLQDIQSFLGHASPLTTQVYLDRLSGPASAHTEALMKVRAEAKELAESLSIQFD